VGFFPYFYPNLPAGSYWSMGIAGAVLLFGSIIIHELFHSIVARRHGLAMKGITLFVFGGIAEMEHEPPSAKAEFLMAIAGPIASVSVGFVFYLLYLIGRGAWPVEALGVVGYLCWINWVLAGFNLIPAFPLDGGRVLRSALWHWKGDLTQATRTASAVGSSFAVVLMVLGVLQLFTGNFVGAVWWFVIGMFLRSVSQASYQQVLMKSTLEGEPVWRFMRTNPDTVTPEISIEDLVNEHIYRHHHRMFPVVSGSHRLAGCVTTDRVKTVPREEWARHRVAEILTPCSDENTIRPDTDSIKALTMMNRTGNSRLLVVEGDRLLAVVTLRDLLSFLSAKLELEGQQPPQAA
jgi:Zn-dependent protease/CBS domain-containing protein